MFKASHSDAEILVHLTFRGIEPSKAARLVDDLRHGREPSAQLPFVPSVDGGPATERPRQAEAGAIQQAERLRRHSHSGTHKRKVVPGWFILLAVVFILALGYGMLELVNQLTRESADIVKHELAPPPGK